MYYSTQTYCTKRVSLEHTHFKSNSGYIGYWKLIYKNFSMLWNTLVANSKQGNYFQKIWYPISFLFTIFYSATIKPIFCVYSTKTYISGSCVITNGSFETRNFKLKKSITHKLFGIPFFCHKSKFSEVELNNILKNHA